MNNLLTVTDWNNYIYKKKLEFIENINNTSSTDTINNLNHTPDSVKFNDILKNHILRINIFNMTYITFMMLKFLETSFIPSEIILNVIEIYNDDELHRMLLINRKIIKQINNNYKLENYKYIKILKYIITTIIDFVVKTELALNIQCLLMTHFIDKIHTNTTNTPNPEESATNTKSAIFKVFNTINTDVITSIKSSTLILLFLKLVGKFNTTYDETNLLYFINEYYDTNFITFINKKNTINKKTNMYLDTFMLDITKYFVINNNNNNNNNSNSNNNNNSNNSNNSNIFNPDIYVICNKYILNNIELIFNNFENIYTILETHLFQSINITENKKVKLSYLKNVIKNIVDIEIDNIKKLFI